MRTVPALLLALIAALIGLGAGSAAASDPLAEAAALARGGKLAEALAAYDRLLAVTPDFTEARKGRARVLGWLDRYAEALADYDRVLRDSPHDVEARAGRARLLGWMARYEEGEAEARRALAIDPRAAEVHAVLGTLLGWQRRFGEAAAAFEQARALAPHDPDPVLGLARLRLWQEDVAGARAAYEAALRLDPGSEEARAGLARIAAMPTPWRIRLDLGYAYASLTGGNSDWHHEWAQLTLRPGTATWLFVGADQYRRFDQDDTQVSLGATRTLGERLGLSARYTQGIGASVVAQRVWEVEAEYRLAAAATVGLRYRRSDFPGDVGVDLVSPGLELRWPPRVSVLLRYYYSQASDSGSGHAGSGRVTFYPEGRLHGYVGFAYGREPFQAGTVQEVTTATDVATVSAGVIWRIRDSIGVRLDYAYENRRSSYAKHTIGSGIFFEFQ
jgi:YaiO family outer membrane protein